MKILSAIHHRIRNLGILNLGILSQGTSPHRAAFAVWVGCVVGCTPFFGLQLPLCIALAWALRLNQVIVYAAANISIPPMIPFLAVGSIELGERLISGHWLVLSREDFTWQNAPAQAERYFTAWLTGGLIIGAILGAVGAALTFFALHARKRRSLQNSPQEALLAALIEKARDRYNDLPPRDKWYARMKYVMDPCYREIAPWVRPASLTVDLGTGFGMLPVVIGLLGEGRQALGVDWDAAKIKSGLIATKGFAGIELRQADARDFEIPPCDAITLIDVLHYYGEKEQRDLLKRCHQALRPGGRILIREGDGARSGGARFTRTLETLVTRFGWNRGPAVRFRPIQDLIHDLQTLGFKVQPLEVAGRLHPGNVLLVAEIN